MTFSPLIPWFLLIPLALLGISACLALAATRPGRGLAWSLRAAALVALSLALLRPGADVLVGATRVEAAADVFIVVDTSASSAAEDWDGDKPRLDGMREDIGAIVDAVPGARYSLITFDSTAEPRMPLTTDSAAMMTAAEVLQPEIGMYSGGTSVGVAADLLRERLEASAIDRPDSARLVFYLGDGEQTAPEGPESFRPAAAYVDGGGVFGYGTEAGGRMRENGGPYGAGEEDYVKDPASGQDAVSVIDERTLTTIAEELGVSYTTRSAQTPPRVEVTVGTSHEGLGGNSVGRTELTWLPLGLVFALLVADQALVVRQWRTLAAVRGAAR